MIVMQLQTLFATFAVVLLNLNKVMKNTMNNARKIYKMKFSKIKQLHVNIVTKHSLKKTLINI